MPRYVYTGSAGFSTGSLAFIKEGISSRITNGSIILEPNGTGTVTSDNLITISAGLESTSTITGSVAVTGGVGITGDLYIGSISPTTINGQVFGSISPASAAFSTLTSTAITTLESTSEVVATKTAATGVVTHDFSEGGIWQHSSISGNFTVNLTNLPITDNRTISINLILVQGATPYYASALQISGVTQTIRWTGYNAPTPQANKIEIESFLITRVAGVWTVHGSLSSFG